MPSWTIAILILVVCIGVSLMFNPDKKTKLKLAELLSDRPERSEQDYYDEFYADSDVSVEVVSMIRNIFSEQFGIDLGALDPDDDLSDDYSLIWDLDSLADVEIILAIEEEFGIEISDGEACGMSSLRSISEIVGSKVDQKNLV